MTSRVSFDLLHAGRTPLLRAGRFSVMPAMCIAWCVAMYFASAAPVWQRVVAAAAGSAFGLYRYSAIVCAIDLSPGALSLVLPHRTRTFHLADVRIARATESRLFWPSSVLTVQLKGSRYRLRYRVLTSSLAEREAVLRHLNQTFANAGIG
jgi:hypothetical protein